MPISDFLRNDTYLVAIRDIHGRARKNLGNTGEREWFYKDGLALDEVAGIWAERDLGNIRNGDIMTKAPEAVDDPNWNSHVPKRFQEEMSGEPMPIIR